MGVLSNRQNLSALIASTRRVITRTSFHYIPAIIFTARTVRSLKIYLFDITLSNVTNVNIMGQTVKGETPRVAQTICPNLFSYRRIGMVIKWIRRRYAIRRSGINIQAQNLSKKGSQVLGIIEGISRTSSIAGGPIQISIRTECQCAA